MGNLLSAARLKVGLLQSQLAEKLGIRQNMVSDYERGIVTDWEGLIWDMLDTPGNVN